MVLENWPRAYTYVHTWNSPSYMINLHNTTIQDSSELVELIWSSTIPIMEKWVGKSLARTSIHGIRVYKRNAILSTR